jgi:integrase
MKLRHQLEKTTRKRDGDVREHVWRIRYWWPARKGEPRRSKVDPKTFREERNATKHALQMLQAIEDHEAGRGPDPFADSPKDLATLVDQFAKVKAAGGLVSRRQPRMPNADSVKRTRQRLALMLERFALRSTADLVRFGPDAATRFAALQEDERAAAGERLRSWGNKTRDEHAQELRQFCEWLMRRGLLIANPIGELPRVYCREADSTFRRRELEPVEIGRLMLAAQADVARGRFFATLWGFAAYTGMREAQLEQLTSADVRALDDRPEWRVDGSRTKSGRDEWLPMPPWLGTRLAELRRVPLTLPLFPDVDWKNVCDVLRRHAAAAGLGEVKRQRGKTEKGEWFYWDRWIDPRGPQWRLDFHAFRKTFAMLLDQPHVGDRDWADLVRHSDARMTRRYRDAKAERHRAIIDALADPLAAVCTTCAPCAQPGAPAGNPGQPTQSNPIEATA